MTGSDALQPTPPTPDQVRFVDRLCERFPTVSTIRDEHLEFNEELLIYGFLAEVSFHVTDMYAASEEDRLEVQRFFDFIEAEYKTGPESVREIIDLGILENLGGPPDDTWRIRDMLGSELRKRIEEMWPSTE